MLNDTEYVYEVSTLETRCDNNIAPKKAKKSFIEKIFMKVLWCYARHNRPSSKIQSRSSAGIQNFFFLIFIFFWINNEFLR